MSNFVCCPTFRPNFLNSKIVFYFIFLLFYCRMYKKKKKFVCACGEGGGGICSNDDNGIYIAFIPSFHWQTSFRRLNLVRFLYL